MQLREVKSLVRGAIGDVVQTTEFVSQVTKEGTKLYASFKAHIDKDSAALSEHAKTRAIDLVTRCSSNPLTSAKKVRLRSRRLCSPGVQRVVGRRESSPRNIGMCVARAQRQTFANRRGCSGRNTVPSSIDHSLAGVIFESRLVGGGGVGITSPGVVAWGGVGGREADRGVPSTLQDIEKCPLLLCSPTCVFSQALTDAVTSLNTATKSLTNAAGVGSTEAGSTGNKKKVSLAQVTS